MNFFFHLICAIYKNGLMIVSFQIYVYGIKCIDIGSMPEAFDLLLRQLKCPDQR